MESMGVAGTLVMKNRFLFSSFHRTQDAEDIPAPSVETAPHVLLHNGCQLHYWLSGPRSAPAIILTHGEGADHHVFDAQVQELARSFRVLTWDIRGHGQSKSEQVFALEVAADDLHAILAHTGLTMAAFVGVSVGGLIAQFFAYRFPEFVHGLALLSCTPLNGELTSLRRFVDTLTTKLLWALPYWLIVNHLPVQFSMRPEVQKYTLEAMKTSGKIQFLAAWQTNAQVFRMEPSRRLPQPLLIAYGAYDRRKWIERAKTLWSQSYPIGNIITVPGAAHSLTQDNPSYATAMLEEFLRQCFRDKRQSPDLGIDSVDPN